MDRPRKVTVLGEEGEFSHFIHKGPNLTYGMVTFKGGLVTEVHHKHIKFIV